jgi:hypothetical protein
MYTDEDLSRAVKAGIFTDVAVEQFREEISASRNMPSVNEENFRLVSGFNDIFVVIASVILLFSSLWAINQIDRSLSLLVFVVISWCLAEFFVLRRQLALPAIVLLLTFVGGLFAFVLSFYSPFYNLVEPGLPLLLATACSAIGAYLHWRRFAVPITIAAFTVAIVGFIVALFITTYPDKIEWLLSVICLCGLLTFIFAMYWDASDVKRITRRADVAFWLHLLSAPLIVHPVFSWLGILDGGQQISSMVIVVALYILITLISLIIDRRAFMVSSLVYVLYAISNLLEAYGIVGQSLAVTGIVIGAALLFLTAFWHKARRVLLKILPAVILKGVPA